MQFNSSYAGSSRTPSTLLCSLEDLSIELPIIKVNIENADTAGFHRNKTFHIRAHVNGNDEDDFFSAHPDNKHVYWTTTNSGNSELFHYEETSNHTFLLKTFWDTYVTFDRKTMAFVQCTQSTPPSNRLYINIPLYESEDDNNLSEEDNESCNSEESLIESMTISEISEVSDQNSYVNVSNPMSKISERTKKVLTESQTTTDNNLDEILDDTIMPPESSAAVNKKTMQKKKSTETVVKKSIPVGLKAYQAFAKSKRQMVKNKNPDFKFSDVNKELGIMWKNSSEEDKRYWFDIVSVQ